MECNWQLKEWPNFSYSIEKIQQISIAFAQEFGAVNGLIFGLTEKLKQEALLEMLIEEAIKTSEIEGEYMNREDVLSSIRNNLGLQESAPVIDKRASGVAKLIVEVNKSLDLPLTLDLICHWHQILMGYNQKINAGSWRQGKEPMRIISGAYAREIVHYEAPPSHTVPAEMEKFIQWYNDSEIPVGDNISEGLLRSAIVHLYFESIHPFEDGNGRIGRALAEFALSQALNTPALLSLSKTIERDKKSYYDQLKTAQRSLEVTEWVNYFSQVLLDAQKDAKELVLFTLKKKKFFDLHKEQLNERQIKVLNRMLENGSTGFEGGMTAKKYMAIAKISKATATRDLQLLYESGVFIQEGAGRSVKYQVKL